MKAHQHIDERSLAMAKAIVAKIDRDPAKAGLAKAKTTCERRRPAICEWLEIQERPWEEVRALVLDESELGQRLRQSDPFCGILTLPERWHIYRVYRDTS